MNNNFTGYNSMFDDDDMDDDSIPHKGSSRFLGNEQDMFFNAPHRSPRMEEIAKELVRDRRNRPLNDIESYNIDMENKPSNRDYALVQVFSQGEGYTPEIVKAYKEGGWKPVKKVRHPELTILTEDDFQEIDDIMMEVSRSEKKAEIPVLTRTDRYIRFGGLVLMEKDSQANQMAIDRINRRVDLQYSSIQKDEFNKRHKGSRMELFMT